MESFIKGVGAKFKVLLDESGGSVGAWNVFAAPSNFLIAPDGQVKYTLYGGVEWDSDDMVKLLKGMAKQ
ncbi:MAG: peroxiredoxin family protein [bacterium]